MRENIRWDESEWQRLAELCLALRVNDPASSLLQLAQRAVAQFPKDRQRELIANKSVEPLVPYIRRLSAVVNSQITGEKPRPEIIKPTYEEVQAEHGARILAEAPIEQIYELRGGELTKSLSLQEVIEEHGVEAILEEVDTPALIGIAVERVCRSIGSLGAGSFGGLELVRSLLQKPVNGVVPHAPLVHKPTQPKPMEPKKSSVLIVGALPQQKQEIAKSRLSGRCRFRFVESDRGKHIEVGSPEVVVAWTSFLDHSTTERIKSQCGDIPLIEYNGGVGKLIDTVERKLNQLA